MKLGIYNGVTLSIQSILIFSTFILVDGPLIGEHSEQAIECKEANVIEEIPSAEMYVT